VNANKKLEHALAVAGKEGLRAAVPAYLSAADAFAQEQRHATAVEMLGQLLLAQEKKRGFLGRVDKNPLGPERQRVAVKFAEIARLASPTENSLEVLEDLVLDFPDVMPVRRANADSLRNAGYAADAIEEFRYCWKLDPKDGEIAVRLADLYAALGRIDEAIEHLRRGVELLVARGEFRQAGEYAMRFLDMHADGVDDALAALGLIPSDVLRTQCASLDHLGLVIRRDQMRKPEWRQERERLLADLYTKILELDKRDISARRGLAALGPAYLEEVEKLVGALPKAEAVGPPVAPPPARFEAPVQTPVELQQPDMVEASQGELVEDVVIASKPDVAPKPYMPGKPAVVHPKPDVLAAKPDVVAAKPDVVAPKPDVVAAKPDIVFRASEASSEKPAAVTPPPPQPAPAKPDVPAPKPDVVAAKPDVVFRASEASSEKPEAAEPPAPPSPMPAPIAASVQPQPEGISPAVAPTGKAAAPNRALATFALRKAQQLFADGNLEEAAQACERVLKHGEDVAALEILMKADLGLKQNEEAVRACIRLADAHLAAGDAPSALDTLTTMAKIVPDPQLILRRSQLLTSLRGPEFAGKS
jgi:tetratricopeptide (TPR) repeat protein